MKKINFTLTIKITILLLTIFFLTKVATYENTVFILNQYTGIVRETPTFDRDEALLVLKSYDMEDSLYVKELLKVNNTWIGNAYNYKEAYEKNYLFKWGEDDQFYNNPNFDEKEREKEYNKNTGYFIIENNTRTYGLSKEEVEKKLNISSLKLKSAEIYMKKYGGKGILKKFYRDFFIALYKDKDYDEEDFMKDGKPYLRYNLSDSFQDITGSKSKIGVEIEYGKPYDMLDPSKEIPLFDEKGMKK